MVAASAGSEIAREAPAYLAISTIWISYMVLAAGVLHAAAVSTFEFYRLAKLLSKNRLRVANIVDLFIPPFTLAYFGLAVQQLGDQALRLSKHLPVLFEDPKLLATILGLFGRFLGFICVFIGMFWQCAGALIFGPFAVNMVLRGSFNTNWLALQFSLAAFGSSIFTLFDPESNRGLEISAMIWGAISIALFHIFLVKALIRENWADDATLLFDTPRLEIERDDVPPPEYTYHAPPTMSIGHEISEAVSAAIV
ncbi:hypothetical protein F4803DRAFT_200469 [Xylaria telfairii]|nr:hypothetical protein F4803DRAFT_200469 [Xylaria telfairii]